MARTVTGPRRPTDVRDLLAEVAWLRRLTRALTDDALAADDLAQDTLAAAVAQPPGLHGDRLRAWLRRVAQRRRWRAQARERQRCAVERAVARPERAADDRLDAARWLHDAVAALPEPYRTAVTLRFFDELSPRQLAQRLGISPAAARQRVHRGLVLLRQRLERQPRGAERLAAALLPAPLPLLAIMSAKLTLLGLGATAVAAAVLLSLWSGDAPAASAPETPPAAAGVAATAAASAAPAGPVRRALTDRAAPTATATAVLRVLGPAGAPALGARAAWRDETGALHALPLATDTATAPLPPNAQGCRLYAGAPGCVTTSAQVPAQPADVTLRLAAGATVRGRVVEREGPAVDLRLHIAAAAGNVARVEGTALRAALAELGLAGVPDTVLTDASGAFVIDDVPSDWRGVVHVPNTHVLYRVDGIAVEGLERSTLHAQGALRAGGDHLLETLRRPCVRGVAQHLGSGAPFVGKLTATLVDRDDAQGGVIWFENTDTAGHFAFGLPVPLTELLDPTGVPPRFDAVTLAFRGVAGGPLTFDLAGRSIPIDLGVVEIGGVARALRVLDAGGAPLAGAVVVSAGETATTGEDGAATLGVAAGGEIEVTAAGHGWLRVTVPVGSAPYEVRLPAAPSLRLSAGDPDARLVVRWKRSPFCLPERPTAPFAFQRSRGDSPSLTWSADGAGAWTMRPGLLVGLVPGAVLEAGVADLLGTPLGLRTLVVPAAAGVHDVALPDAAGHVLTITVTGSDAVPLADAAVFFGNATRGRSLRTDATGQVAIAPLAAGRLRGYVQARGYVPHHFSVDLTADRALRIELLPAHALAVRVVDSRGKVWTPAKVEVQSPDGTPYQLEALPPRPLTVRARLGTRSYEIAVGPQQTEVTLAVPAHGALRIVGGENDGGGRLTATIEAEDGRRAVVTAAADGGLMVPLLPGRYRLRLERVRGGAFGVPRTADVVLERTVEIRAGETLRLAAE